MEKEFTGHIYQATNPIKALKESKLGDVLSLCWLLKYS